MANPEYGNVVDSSEMSLYNRSYSSRMSRGVFSMDRVKTGGRWPNDERLIKRYESLFMGLWLVVRKLLNAMPQRGHGKLPYVVFCEPAMRGGETSRGGGTSTVWAGKSVLIRVLVINIRKSAVPRLYLRGRGARIEQP